MRLLFPMFVLLTSALAGARAELKITGDTKVPAYRLVRLSAEGLPTGSALLWDVSPEEPVDIEEVSGRLLFAGPPGTYKIKLRAIKLAADGKTSVETARATVVIGEPPTPPPPPDPPTPPDPPPIPTTGLRVLIVYESGELAKLPKGQLAVIYSKSVRDYLNGKCTVGPDGKTREWRMWDKDVDASGESTHWQTALKRPRTSVPWILISDGKKGFEGALPASVDDTLALLKKYGG